MIRITFFCVDNTTKQQSTSNFMYYEDLNDITIQLINSQQINLQRQLPNSKIFLVFENVTIKVGKA